jgi:hypothetical protein
MLRRKRRIPPRAALGQKRRLLGAVYGTFQQVSSTPMNGLEIDAGAIQNLVVCHGGMAVHGARPYPARLAHLG